LLIRHASSSSL
jgi:alkyl hydroperoxide reductase subunit AhpC